jgi:uncharacterized membrane protein YfhO
VYSLLFALFSLGGFWGLIINGKSFIESGDALSQHSIAISWWGDYLRTAVKSFSLPMYDYSIGYGADILTSFHYYGVGDPFMLLAALFPKSQVEAAYAFLYLLRLYFAGLFFSRFCLYMGKGRKAAMLGAFIYIFSSFTFVYAIRHHMFTNALLWLPLLLLGVEKILKKEKPYTFILAVFFAGISNFYFFYMNVLLTVVYVAVRVFFVYREKRARSISTAALKLLGFGAVGTAMSCAIFLPVVLAILGTDRGGADVSVPLLFSKEYYLHYISMPISTESMWSIAAIAFGAAIFLFSLKRKHLQLKIGFVIMNLFMLLPFLQSASNAFSYAAQRVGYGYVFMISFIFASVFPEIVKAERAQLKRFAILAAAVAVLCFVTQSQANFGVLESLFFIAAMIALPLLIKKHRAFALSLLAVISIFAFSTHKFSTLYSENVFSPMTVSKAADSKSVYPSNAKNGSVLAKEIQKDEPNSFFRFGEYKLGYSAERNV